MDSTTTRIIKQPVYEIKPMVAPLEQQADIAALYHVLKNSQTEGLLLGNSR